MRDCLAATGVSVFLATGLALALLGAGILLVWYRRRTLARGAGLGLVAILATATLAVSLVGGTQPAQASQGTECASPPATSSAPPTNSSTPPAPAPVVVPAPTATPTPTPEPTPTPVPTFTLSGTYTKDGQQILITDPPGDYPAPPTNPPTGPVGTDWSMPTYPTDAGPVAAVTVTLLDGTGAVVATTTTDSAGQYSFSVTPGDYVVRVDDLPTPDRTTSIGTWAWVVPNTTGFCNAVATVDPWTLPPSVPTTITDTNITGINFTSTNTAGNQAACDNLPTE